MSITFSNLLHKKRDKINKNEENKAIDIYVLLQNALQAKYNQCFIQAQ
jgi:hypothetical protein